MDAAAHRAIAAHRARVAASDPGNRALVNHDAQALTAVIHSEAPMRHYNPLVAMAGAPGSGKTTFARGHFPAGSIFSLDAIRGWLTDDVADQTATQQSVRILSRILAERCSRNLLTVVDATNATQPIRDDILRHAHRYQRPALLIVMHTPLDVCRDRQADRHTATPDAPHGRAVPLAVVDRIHQQIQGSLPLIRYGFRAVLHVLPDGTRALEGCRDPFTATLPWLADTPAIQPTDLPALLDGATR